MSFPAEILLALFIESVNTSAQFTSPIRSSSRVSAAQTVAAAYGKVEAGQAKLPPPRNDRERLVRLQARDQAGRDILATIDLSGLTKEGRKTALAAMSEQILKQDLRDQSELKALIPRSGWFAISVYGRDGALAAWLVVQHATNDPGLMRRTVAALDRMRRTGEAQPTAYAIMYDRVALIFDHKPQRYGTQLGCRSGHLLPENVENLVHLDSRRKAVGFKQTEAAYVREMDDGYCRRIGG